MSGGVYGAGGWGVAGCTVAGDDGGAQIRGGAADDRDALVQRVDPGPGAERGGVMGGVLCTA